MYSQKTVVKMLLELIAEVGEEIQYEGTFLYDYSDTFYEILMQTAIVFLETIRSKSPNKEALIRKIVSQIDDIYNNGEKEVQEGIVIGFLEDASNRNFRKGISIRTIKGYLTKELIQELDNVLDFWNHVVKQKKKEKNDRK